MLSLTNHRFIKRCFQALLLHQRRRRRNLGGSLCVLASSGPASPVYLYHLQSTRFPLSMEFSRQEHWSRLSFPSPEDLPDPGIEPGSSALQADSLPCEPQGSPIYNTSFCQFQSPLSILPPNLPLLPCGCKVKNCYPCVTLCDLSSYTDTTGVHSVSWDTLDRGWRLALLLSSLQVLVLGLTPKVYSWISHEASWILTTGISGGLTCQPPDLSGHD